MGWAGAWCIHMQTLSPVCIIKKARENFHPTLITPQPPSPNSPSQRQELYVSCGPGMPSLCVFKSSPPPLNTILFYFILFFIFGHPKAYGVPGPGIRSELQLSKAAAILDPLTDCTRLGVKPESWHCRDTADPLAAQQEHLNTV